MTRFHFPASAFRRRFIGAPGLSGLAAASPLPAGSASPRVVALGIKGQRIADQGDGTFLNPILAGDHPDPTILKDGVDYYLTCSRLINSSTDELLQPESRHKPRQCLSFNSGKAEGLRWEAMRYS